MSMSWHTAVTPLVRERSTVQSCPAAPLIPSQAVERCTLLCTHISSRERSANSPARPGKKSGEHDRELFQAITLHEVKRPPIHGR